MAAGGVITSVVVESLSVDPSNVPPAVVTVATVGVGTTLTDRMFNLQGRIVIPPRYYAAVTEFRQPLQVQSHLEMPRILVQLGHTQRT